MRELNSVSNNKYRIYRWKLRHSILITHVFMSPWNTRLKITGTKIRGNLSSDENFVEIETMIIVRDRDWQMKKNVSRWSVACDRRQEGIAFQLSNLPFDVPFHSISLRDFARVYISVYTILHTRSTCVSSSSSPLTYRDIYTMVDRCGL